MCGRFALYAPAARITEIFGLIEPADLRPRYNIPPTDPIAIVLGADEGPKLAIVRWGLVPFFLKDNKGPPHINARVETLLDKPLFRKAFEARRCLVPASVFFEWEKDGKARKAWRIGMDDDELFAMAGVWESYRGDDGVRHASAAILTTQANALVAPIHDRMPVILPRSDWSPWLDRRDTDAAAWIAKIQPFPAAAMRAVRVGPLVGNVKNDDPACIAPFDG